MQTLQSDSGAEKECCNVGVLVDKESDSVVFENKSEESINAPEKVNMHRVTLTNPISERLQTHPCTDVDEDDIYFLTRDSLLFSQISKNDIIPPEETVVASEPVDGCQMVAVKESEVSTPMTRGVESREHLVILDCGVEYHPLPVEIVEIVETDVDGDLEYMEENEGEYEVDQLSSNFSRNRRKRVKLDIFPSNANSVLLEVTDRINRTEEATVTACSSSNIYDIDTYKSTSYETLKEVKLKKEIEMSRTYQIVGNFENSEANVSAIDESGSFYGSDKETDDVISFSEDEGNHKKDNEDSSSSTDDLYNVCPNSPEPCVTEVGLLF